MNVLMSSRVCDSPRSFKAFASLPPAPDPERGAPLLHGTSRPAGQDPDPQSEGPPHLRHPLLYPAHRLPVLQEVAERPVPPGPPVQGWVTQGHRSKCKGPMTQWYSTILLWCLRTCWSSLSLSTWLNLGPFFGLLSCSAFHDLDIR